jgi:hypothetical protein
VLEVERQLREAIVVYRLVLLMLVVDVIAAVVMWAVLRSVSPVLITLVPIYVASFFVIRQLSRSGGYKATQYTR